MGIENIDVLKSGDPSDKTPVHLVVNYDYSKSVGIVEISEQTVIDHLIDGGIFYLSATMVVKTPNKKLVTLNLTPVPAKEV